MASRLKYLAYAAVFAAHCSGAALAGEKKYDTGATDTEIKIGNTMPYSGQGSAWGLLGRAEAAYFDKVNAEGGINGRTIRFISYDDVQPAQDSRANTQAGGERRGTAVVQHVRSSD
jgi:ABC-type branched-subunit amino acid transport system substrate-binding protein